MRAGQIETPWSEEQVTLLNQWQRDGRVHPYTCGQRDGHRGDGVLIAKRDGWHCTECDYTQDWAWDPKR